MVERGALPPALLPDAGEDCHCADGPLAARGRHRKARGAGGGAGAASAPAFAAGSARRDLRSGADEARLTSRDFLDGMEKPCRMVGGGAGSAREGRSAERAASYERAD